MKKEDIVKTIKIIKEEEVVVVIKRKKKYIHQKHLKEIKTITVDLLVLTSNEKIRIIIITIIIIIIMEKGIILVNQEISLSLNDGKKKKK